jgi:hypothetical protein
MEVVQIRKATAVARDEVNVRYSASGEQVGTGEAINYVGGVPSAVVSRFR